MSFTPEETRQIVADIATIKTKVEGISNNLPEIKSDVKKNTKHRFKVNSILALLTFLIPVYLKFFHKPHLAKQVKNPPSVSRDNP